MVVGTVAPITGAACRVDDTNGDEGVLVGLAVDEVHLVDVGASRWWRQHSCLR
jgi:hypothetical protein